MLKVENGTLCMWRELYDDLERRQAAGGDLEDIPEHASKMAGTVAGIAGSLHVLRHRESGVIPYSISEEDMQSAVAIGRWAIGHALAVAGMMGLEPGQQLAARVIERARKRGVRTFTQRDALRWFRGETAREIDQAIAVLISHGLVTQQVVQTGGRPSRRLAVVEGGQ